MLAELKTILPAVNKNDGAWRTEGANFFGRKKEGEGIRFAAWEEGSERGTGAGKGEGGRLFRKTGGGGKET